MGLLCGWNQYKYIEQCLAPSKCSWLLPSCWPCMIGWGMSEGAELDLHLWLWYLDSQGIANILNLEMSRIGTEISSLPIMRSQCGEACLQSISSISLHCHFPIAILVSTQIFPLDSVVERTKALESGRPGLGPPCCPLWTKRPLGSSSCFWVWVSSVNGARHTQLTGGWENQMRKCVSSIWPMLGPWLQQSPSLEQVHGCLSGTSCRVSPMCWAGHASGTWRAISH